MNVINFWLAYQCSTRTAETQANLCNYFAEEMMDKTYDRFMMRSADRRGRNIVDSDEKTFDDKHPMFGRINGDPRCGIALHVTPTKNMRKKRYWTETQYLLQGECKVCCKKTTHVCSDCTDTNVVKNEIWVFHHKTHRSYFSQHVHITHEL